MKNFLTTFTQNTVRMSDSHTNIIKDKEPYLKSKAITCEFYR